MRIAAVVTALIAGSLACNFSAADPTDAPAVEEETAIAGTVAARMAQTSDPEATSTSTQTESTLAPVQTVPPSATSVPQDSPTPSVPMVSVSVDTNCRKGPGRSYDYLGALLVGETEEVVARSTLPNYWYITNPDRPGEFCYLWGQYATVVGNTEILAELTPLPSPTATTTPTPSNTPTPSYTPSPTP